jgi:hypothetical protein
MDLLHFIVIGNKKQGVGFEYKLILFWTHDACRGLVSRSCYMS